jgi:ABC-type histidine transport system ATPase subunit
MADGTIEEIATPKELFEHPATERLRNFLGRYRDAHLL